MNIKIKKKESKYILTLEIDKEEFKTLESDLHRIENNNTWWLNFDWYDLLEKIINTNI